MATEGQTLPRAERLHQLSYAAYGTHKRLSYAAYTLEVCAAALPFLDHSAWTQAASYRPLVAILLIVASSALRRAARSSHEFADHARQQSLRALASHTDISADEARRETERVPTCVGVLAHSLMPELLRPPTPLPLPEYYGCTGASTSERMRTAYAESSFWTTALLRVTQRIYCAIAVLAILIVAGYLYRSAVIGASGAATPQAIVSGIDTLFSVVLTVIAFRAVEAYLDCRKVMIEASQISDVLMSSEPISESELTGLCRRYDIAITQGPPIPDWVYRWCKSELSSRSSEYLPNVGKVA